MADLRAILQVLDLDRVLRAHDPSPLIHKVVQLASTVFPDVDAAEQCWHCYRKFGGQHFALNIRVGDHLSFMVVDLSFDPFHTTAELTPPSTPGVPLSDEEWELSVMKLDNGTWSDFEGWFYAVRGLWDENWAPPRRYKVGRQCAFTDTKTGTVVHYRIEDTVEIRPSRTRIRHVAALPDPPELGLSEPPWVSCLRIEDDVFVTCFDPLEEWEARGGFPR